MNVYMKLQTFCWTWLFLVDKAVIVGYFIILINIFNIPRDPLRAAFRYILVHAEQDPHDPIVMVDALNLLIFGLIIENIDTLIKSKSILAWYFISGKMCLSQSILTSQC